MARGPTYLKFGGVRFEAVAPEAEINKAAGELAKAGKDTMFEVAQELSRRKLIKIIAGDFNTIDDEMYPYQK